MASSVSKLKVKEFVMETTVKNAWDLFIDEVEEESDELPESKYNTLLAW